MTTPNDELAGKPLTTESARELTEFSLYVKTARTLISDRTFPPGTTYQTPEGLRAEDEETRAALDVQGGIYPIRESVFRASYAPDAPPYSMRLTEPKTAAVRVAEFIEHARLIALAVWSSEDDDELRKAVRKIEGSLGSALKEIAFRTDATLDAARSTPVPASDVSEGLREALIRAVASTHGYDHPDTATGSWWEHKAGPVLEVVRAALAHAAPEGLDVFTLAAAINDAQIKPEELRLGHDLAPVARRILAHLRSQPDATEAVNRAFADALDVHFQPDATEEAER